MKGWREERGRDPLSVCSQPDPSQRVEKFPFTMDVADVRSCRSLAAYTRAISPL